MYCSTHWSHTDLHPLSLHDALPIYNFYPVTLTDLKMAARRKDSSRLDELTAIRAERFALMAGLAQLPKDMVFFTQITMEAAEDRKSTRLNSSHLVSSYAVFCLKKKK